MTRHSQRFFATFCMVISMSAYAEPLPKSLLVRIPHEYQILSHKRGDLNGDGREDYVVALHKKDEEAIAQRTGEAPGRPLMIFIQHVDGTFALAKRNDFVVFAADEGGQCDPFEGSAEGLAVSGLYFTVQNDVACGAHWSDYITFRFVRSLQDWVFHKRIVESWVMNNSNEPEADALVLEGRHVTNGKDKPPIRFEEYRP